MISTLCRKASRSRCSASPAQASPTPCTAPWSGIGPDIIFNYPSEAAQYVKAGQVADLSQYIYDETIGIRF